MKLTEKQIEDVFEIYYKELLSSDFELVERQFVFKNKRRADLIFIDKDKRKVIVELKRGAVTREDIGQLFEYRVKLK
jgi:predicted nuclease of restriction endonuclease-like (RecB) superfamily